MTALVCRQCGEGFEPVAKGPRPKFCSDRCRVAAHRGTPAQGAAKEVAAESLPAPVTSKPSWRPDLGDGDRCPQDPGHGRMYFMKPSMQRQWCPSSGHQGDPFYQRDGVTPASRPPAQAEPAPNPAEHRALDPERATEASIGTAGASTPPAAAALQPPSATRAGSRSGTSSTAAYPNRAREDERPSRSPGVAAQLALPAPAP